MNRYDDDRTLVYQKRLSSGWYASLNERVELASRTWTSNSDADPQTPQTAKRLSSVSECSSSSVQISEDDVYAYLIAGAFAVYDWLEPRPKNFLQLSPAHKRFKLLRDAIDEAKPERRRKPLIWDDVYVDLAADEADDHDIVNAIADHYVYRAKWAFREKEGVRFEQGRLRAKAAKNAEVFLGTKSLKFKHYEEEELTSIEEAEEEVAEIRAGDNGQEVVYYVAQRLPVWSAIKRRLCEEIWLEEYSAKKSGEWR